MISQIQMVDVYKRVCIIVLHPNLFAECWMFFFAPGTIAMGVCQSPTADKVLPTLHQWLGLILPYGKLTVCYGRSLFS
jgi:hypothetical protein